MIRNDYDYDYDYDYGHGHERDGHHDLRERDDRSRYDTLRRTAAHTAFARGRQLLLDLRTDLDAARSAFDWPRPAAFNWALEWFDVHADGNHRPALEFPRPDGSTRTVSYQQLSARSDQVANWLAGLGIRRGHRVMVVLGQQAELWETLLACLKLGAVVIPAYTSLTRAEATDRVARSCVQHVVVRSDTADLFEQAALATRVAVGPPVPGWLGYDASHAAPWRYLPEAPTPATAPAFGYFTSGTTSEPKLVIHTHASYPVGHLSSMYFNGLLPGDRHVNISEPGWAKHSWSSLFVPFTAGATLLVLPPEAAGTSQLPALPALLEEHRATSLCAPPSLWRRLAPHAASARPPLREATSAGEPLPAETAAAIDAAWGVPLRDGYGQTETTALVGTTPGMPRRPGWLGRPLPGWDLSVEDNGDLCVALGNAPVGMMSGYDRDPARTREALGGPLYRTGDVAETAPDGYMRLLGRADDVFKSGGHRVSPYELEAVLRTHPAVRDAAVVPVAHPALGQAAHAVAERAEGSTATAAGLLAHVDARVTPALRVHSVTFTDRLPRTVSGKVRRSAVRPGEPGHPCDSAASHSPQGETVMPTASLPALLPSVLRGTTEHGALPEETVFEPLTADGRTGVGIHRLYTTDDTGDGGPAAGIVRYAPGAATAPHRHEGYEIIYVFEGALQTDSGTHPAGSLLVMEPGSTHAPRSAEGAVLLVVWEQPVALL